MTKRGGGIRARKASALSVAVSSVAVRPAKLSEGEALTSIALLSKGSWGYPDEYLQLWKDELTITDAYISVQAVWCAERGGTVVGFYSLKQVAEGLELDFLYLLPNHMGQGVGSALLRHAMELAREMGVQSLRIVSDPNAEGFYRKHGARRIGMMPSKPDGRSIPLLRLQVTRASAHDHNRMSTK